MSVEDAEPGDIYADEAGKLWRIIGVCREPTVTAEEVEGTLYDPSSPPHLQLGGAALGLVGFTPRATINKAQRSGGIGGFMWSGWKRIWRKERTDVPILPEWLGKDKESIQ